MIYFGLVSRPKTTLRIMEKNHDDCVGGEWTLPIYLQPLTVLLNWRVVARKGWSAKECLVIHLEIQTAHAITRVKQHG